MSNRTFYLASAVTLIFAMMIAFGTLSPPSQGGQGLPINDKLLHFTAFGLLVLPLAWFNSRFAIWLIPVAILYGGLIELLQPLVGRSADWADLFADIGGVLTGVLIGKAGQRNRVAHSSVE